MSFFSRLFSLKPDATTDAEFARTIGVSKWMMNRWRLMNAAGITDYLPRPSILNHIAEVLGTTPSWLAFGDPNVPRTDSELRCQVSSRTEGAL